MKITKIKLQQIIKEETHKLLIEQGYMAAHSETPPADPGLDWVGLNSAQVIDEMAKAGVTYTRGWEKQLPADHPVRVKFKNYWQARQLQKQAEIPQNLPDTPRGRGERYSDINLRRDPTFGGPDYIKGVSPGENLEEEASAQGAGYTGVDPITGAGYTGISSPQKQTVGQSWLYSPERMRAHRLQFPTKEDYINYVDPPSEHEQEWADIPPEEKKYFREAPWYKDQPDQE